MPCMKMSIPREFLSTLSLRRATWLSPTRPIDNTISIHALLAESDLCHHISKNAAIDFYPRSPCGERPFLAAAASFRLLFLSTLSLRRATFLKSRRNKNPMLFLSTLSLRRATSLPSSGWGFMLISIHALLAESDYRCNHIAANDRDFYPRSPCGERRTLRVMSAACWKFLSTLSLRRATGLFLCFSA